MTDYLSVSFFTAVVYLVLRFINMNFIEKEPQPVKVLLKDTLMVFVSVSLGLFLMSQVTSLSLSGGEGTISGKSVDAFTGEPEF